MTGAAKSTFAAPASATSGLQGYDLEGATGKKVSKTKADYVASATTEQCQSCTSFMAPDACTRVRGKIAMGGHCKLYTAINGTVKRAPILAAGCALVTDEGRALFLKRSDEGDHAGEWCFPGGKIEPGETAEQAAIRETFEEAGLKLNPTDERVQVCRIANSDVDFTTFFQRVDDEFEPKLDHEHIGFRWASIEEPPEPLHPGVRASLSLVISQATEMTMKVTGPEFAKGEQRTLYIKRRLRTAEALKSWATAVGFPTTLEPDDMHVTIAYSREPVEWAQVPRSSQPILRIEGGTRTLDRLGKEGEAVVLRFEADDLASRHREIHDAGAVWSWPDYKPHITLTYQGEAVPLDRLTPWDGVLEFGPEEWSEVKENWMATVVEKSDAGDVDMNNLSLFVPLLKVDVKQQIVYGTAVEEVEDRAREIFDYASSKPEFEKWSGDIEKSTDGKSKGNVRSMHGKIAAGKLTDIGFDDERKAIDVAAKIVDKDEWQKVLEGVYTGFSIGGSYLKRWTDGDLKRYTARPAEISLVDLPCVPTATFSVIKADGSEELRKFQQPVADEVKTITNEAVAARAEEMAKAAGGHFLDHIAEARKQLEDVAKKAATTNDEETAAPDAEAVAKAEEAAKVAAVAAASNSSGGDWEQVWVSKRLPGQTFSKKGDLAKALVELDAKEAAAAAAAPVLDALKAAGTDIEAIEKRKFSEAQRAKDAATGAAEKDGSYPIENEKDLEEAIKAYGRSKNKAKTKRHIVSRAKALGLTDKLPEGWFKKVQDSEDNELQKSADLYFVADLLHMLSCVENLEERAEFTALFGGVAVPKELTDRFGMALVEVGDIVADMLDLVLNEIRAEEAAEATKAAMFADLLKRGARHSARDKAIIKKTHDHMVDLDKSCCDGAMSKVEGGVDIVKVADFELVTAENEQLKADKAAHGELLKDIKVGIDTMKAEMDTIRAENAELKKASNELKVDLSAIRYTPAPVPPGTFRLVEKGIPVEIPQVSDEELRRRGEEAHASRLLGPR
jgi:8-oxo-dGTP pyrophosphatase MutT (NUDIX family)